MTSKNIIIHSFDNKEISDGYFNRRVFKSPRSQNWNPTQADIDAFGKIKFLNLVKN